jgi:phenylpropionate dioxygenase-like ring-hydroxylating dioxygenase large terminal subunit
VKNAVFSPEWYFEEVYHRKEWENLFSKTWIYAGLVARVKQEGQYFTIKLFDKTIVIHRLQGEVKAYLNVCPHRGGPLVLQRDGKGSPVCKYHGWAFRSGDDLTGLTNLEWFNSDNLPRGCGRKLRTLAVKLVGPVVFVNYDQRPRPIEDQYSPEILTTLENYGEISDFVVSVFDSSINWKLNIENVKDFLHPFYVHPESFKPLLNYEEKSPTRIDTAIAGHPDQFLGTANLKNLSFKTVSELRHPTPWWSEKIKITQPKRTYQNVFLFPNTNFCSVSGAHYVIQQYLPRTPEKFEYVLTAALPSKLVRFDTTVLLASLIKSERAVIYEDDLILMKVQENLRAGLADSHFSHGDYEGPIMSQHVFFRDCVYQQ